MYDNLHYTIIITLIVIFVIVLAWFYGPSLKLGKSKKSKKSKFKDDTDFDMKQEFKSLMDRQTAYMRT